ncbi:hypothetical protein Rvan_3165 [Rhodomicrobium vannielii ATCC 17100]|uniref:Transmembrane protein n=1 Tax=Rhodomicrobium vannielii (strain ATCC 17100 / DSM 162 / LMG 4299 / NCIMB 10020 / ATH 3.1.1) TaxID=648757 RepID=E3I139_RHOVT|nr:hypothetical protein [Rhodomicrobium vannielii]ADP72362.1 hypothetical protein Rvan_3165 [Rhodomicrobium vannielii ATCC 17100]
MLLDGAKAMRISLLIALAAFGWIAVYIEFNEELRRRIGDGAHASAFLSLFVGLSAFITAFYFRRLARIRADLAQGKPLARWLVARGDWDAFAATEARETEEGHRATLFIILGFAVVIPAVLALILGDAQIFAVISLGIMAVGAIGFLLGRNAAKAHLRYRDGVVSVGEDGVLVNGVVHGWRLPGSALVGVELDESATPAVLAITYAFWTRGGRQYVTVHAPVPSDAIAEARAAVDRLQARAEGRAPERTPSKQTAGFLAMLAVGGLIVQALPAAAQTDDWQRFKIDEASVATPPGWRAELTEERRTVQAIEPRGGREVRVWWWFPDEPLLGYTDEIAHDKVTVAGQPALRVHTRFEGRDTISVTLDKPRKDGKRLHFLFEAQRRLDINDPALMGMVTRLTLAGWATSNTSPETPDAVDVSGGDAGAAAEPEPEGPVQRAELGNIAAVVNGPRKNTIIAIKRPIFVRTLETYHWNNARGRKPGIIALLRPDGTEVGRWVARGKPGQGGVPNAYWEADVNQRLDEGSYVLTTSSNETWATNAGVGWRGFYSMDYQLLRQEPTPEPLSGDAPPDDPQTNGTSPDQTDVPVAPTADDDPARPLKPGETQTLVFYQGDEVLPPWSAFQGQGGKFKDHARVESGALRVRVPEGSGNGLVGLYSEDSLLWLDSLRNGGEAVLTFDFDPSETSGFLIGLSTHHNLNGNEPSNPRFLLHWRRTADGKGKATLIRDYNATLEKEALAKAPRTVRLVISEKGVRVDGEGLPADVTPWGDLSEAQGFRIYAISRPDKNGEAVSMALKRITLSRKGGEKLAADVQPAQGVAPLPSQVLFEGKPGALWQAAGLHADQEAKFVAFRSAAMIADVPEKINDWAMAGLLTAKPLLRFNERIAKTPYRLILTLDPRLTTGLRIVFSGDKVQEMWGGMAGAFRLIRRTQGEMAGKTHLQIRANGGPYAVWDRAISSAFLDRNWDGRIVLTIGDTWATAELPGIVSLRGTAFNLGPGASKYMTIYSEPEKEYQPSRLVLRRIEGGWVTPAGMTAAERWTLVDDAAFDKDRFLDDLAADLDAPSQPN